MFIKFFPTLYVVCTSLGPKLFSMAFWILVWPLLPGSWAIVGHGANDACSIDTSDSIPLQSVFTVLA